MGLTGPVQANDIVMRASEIGTTIPGIASLAMKSARKGAQRGVQGIYQLPSGQEPTPEFMNVSQQNLNNQTRQMADMLNMMAPEDEQLAYINEQEAGILKLLGGSGEMTPQGIPTYRGIGGYGGGDEGPGSGSSGSSNGSNGSNGSGGGGGGGGQDAGATSSSGDMGLGAGVSGEVSSSMGGLGLGGSDTDNDGYRESVEEATETEVDRETMETIAKDAATVRDKYGNPITNTNPNTGVKTNVFSKKAFDDSMKNYDDQKIRESYYNQMLSEKFYDDNPAFNFDQRAALSSIAVNELGDPDFSSIDPSAYGTYEGKMQDRLGELTAKAKANTISNTELDEMAQLNEFYGKNPTTGMGLTESLRYQFTNQQFQDDITKAAPVLGAAALTAFAPGIVKSIMGINNLMKMFSDKPSTSLRTTIENQLKKLTGKEKKALAKTLPSTYKGFGIQGEDRGQGGDRRAQEEAKRRAAEEEARRRAEEEAENNRERDRFERAFANRYFIGPASLDEVRKYAITGGGYNQLTPFYGREKETV